MKRSFFLLGTLVLLFLAAVPGPEVDAASCGASTGNWFIGKFHTVTNIGAQAQISYKEPTLCSSGANWSDSSVWVMSYYDVATPHKYLQAGYGKTRSDAHAYMFTEWSPAEFSVNYQKVYYSSSPGANNYYKIGLDTSNNTWYMGWSSDGVNWTNYDTVSDSLFSSSTPGTPNKTQYLAEVHDQFDAIPGSSTQPAVFSSMQYKTTGGSWTAESNLTVKKDTAISTHANIQDITTTSFKIWDIYNP